MDNDLFFVDLLEAVRAAKLNGLACYVDVNTGEAMWLKYTDFISVIHFE